MAEDPRRMSQGRIDAAIDEMLGEMAGGEPPPSLRASVMRRLGEAAGRKASLAGLARGGRPDRRLGWGAIAGLATAAAASLLLYWAWPVPQPVSPSAPPAEVVAGGPKPGAAAQGPVAAARPAVQTGAIDSAVSPGASAAAAAPGLTPETGAGQPAAEPAAADDPETDAAGGFAALIVEPGEEDDTEGALVPRMVIRPIGALPPISIPPLAVSALAIDPLRITPIEVKPLDPGGQSSTVGQPPRRERQ